MTSSGIYSTLPLALVFSFFSFLARRLHICCRNRRQGDLRRPLRSQSDAESCAWTAEKLAELIGGEAPVLVRALPQCSICFEEGAAGLMNIPCKHVLCEECARKIFAEHLECPFCRGEISGAKELKEDPTGLDVAEVVLGCKIEDSDEEDYLRNTTKVEAPSGYVALSDDGEDAAQEDGGLMRGSQEEDEEAALTTKSN